LITDTPTQYEKRAFELANSVDRLADIRQRLAVARKTSRLFDGAQFAADLEQAYQEMWHRFLVEA
jgi:predicted O-linked N-acetylglucosamine transferase (SPINDLY family)